MTTLVLPVASEIVDNPYADLKSVVDSQLPGEGDNWRVVEIIRPRCSDRVLLRIEVTEPLPNDTPSVAQVLQIPSS